MKVRKKTGSNLLAGLISAVLCLALICAPGLTLNAGSAKTSRQLTEARKKAEQIRKQLADAQADLKKLEADAAKKSSDYAWLVDRTKEQQEAYLEAMARKNNAMIIMEQTTSDYEAAVQEFEEQKQAYGERLALMYQLPDQSIFEALISSANLQSYFTTNRLIRIISDTDELMLARLQEAEAYASEMKEAAEASYEDMQKLVADADKLLAEIKNNRDLSAAELKQAKTALSAAEEESLAWAAEMKSIEDDVASLQKKYKKELAAEEAKRKAEEEAKRKAAEEARRKAAQEAEQKKKAEEKKEAEAKKKQERPAKNKSGWTWPVPSSRNITSRYGYRTYYLKGKKMSGFHYGLDIAAPTGTKIVAIKGGVVLACSRNKISGKYVSVDHGDGYVSSYRHLSRYAVKPGQSVSAGQVVGYMGSTGRSTGPHLHLDIKVNGKFVNPLKYVSP
ncbi:MAG: peptidoglycan DD-metalloendopeptidase family protein [Clostridiaceae bacterium]|nr:peptidoglycan DD-metalloendopeptidase family protein [Clostridiaceae bacterium]